jgi:hypothetical protein
VVGRIPVRAISVRDTAKHGSKVFSDERRVRTRHTFGPCGWKLTEHAKTRFGIDTPSAVPYHDVVVSIASHSIVEHKIRRLGIGYEVSCFMQCTCTMRVLSTSFWEDKRIAILQAPTESESLTLHDRQESGASKAEHDLFALALKEEVAWIPHPRSRGAKVGNLQLLSL